MFQEKKKWINVSPVHSDLVKMFKSRMTHKINLFLINENIVIEFMKTVQKMILSESSLLHKVDSLSQNRLFQPQMTDKCIFER